MDCRKFERLKSNFPQYFLTQARQNSIPYLARMSILVLYISRRSSRWLWAH